MYSDSEMEEGVLEELIYSQCFNYMNWTGSVRVPGVMQYAKKLATFISDNINTKNEAEQLNKHLYYIWTMIIHPFIFKLQWKYQ